MAQALKTVTVTEGSTELKVPDLKQYAHAKDPHFQAPVFYNPAMELNRDLSVCAVKAYQKLWNKKLYIADPFSGIGARGLRYAKEVKGVGKVVLNDLSKQALGQAKANAKLNKIPAKKISFENLDANHFLTSHVFDKFNVVDLDPFGTPVPFYDSAAVGMVRHNGLITATATDTTALCGASQAQCQRKYGATSLHNELMKEAGVRILIQSIMRDFAKHEISLTPLLSISRQHYMKVFLVTSSRPALIKENIQGTGFAFHCTNCKAYGTTDLEALPKECGHCKGKVSVAGPMWLGSLHDPRFLEECLKQASGSVLGQRKDALKVLQLCKDELEFPPFFFDLEAHGSRLKKNIPPIEGFIAGLKSKGFKAGRTQFSTTGVKTNASFKQALNLL